MKSYKAIWSGIIYEFVRYNYDKKKNIISVVLKNTVNSEFTVLINDFQDLFVEISINKIKID